MRDVAVAGEPAQPRATSAASAVRKRPLHLLLPKRSDDTSQCQLRATRRRDDKRIEIHDIFRRTAIGAGRRRRASLAGCGNSCRAGILPAINHKATPYLLCASSGPNRTALAATPGGGPARVGRGLFAVASTRRRRPQAPRLRLRTLGGIDALIALQGVEDPVERRRRAVKHGRRALDALDELKLGLLAGTLDQATMLRLKSVAADLQDGSGDDRLDQVLAEIDLRVAVELAKAGLLNSDPSAFDPVTALAAGAVLLPEPLPGIRRHRSLLSPVTDAWI